MRFALVVRVDRERLRVLLTLFGDEAVYCMHVRVGLHSEFAVESAAD